MLKEYLSALANAFRTVLDTTDKINAQSFPDKIAEVYEAGHAEGVEVGRDMGYEEGHTKGYEQGEQAEYDRFWDNYQDYGNRDYYPYAFGGPGWVGIIDEMKYPIKIGASSTGSSNMFSHFNRGNSGSVLPSGELYDMTELSKKIDFSQAKGVNGTFSNAIMKNLTCDFSNATSLNSTFSNSNGGAMENLTLKVTDKCQSFSSTFYYQNSMTTIRFTDDSVIAANIDFKHSPLTKESITSIINALSDETTDKILTLKQTAVNTAFETSEGAGDGSTSDEWLALIATKANWTITLS